MGFVTFAHFTCQRRCALKDRTKENQSLGALDVGAKSTENGLFLASVTMSRPDVEARYAQPVHHAYWQWRLCLPGRRRRGRIYRRAAFPHSLNRSTHPASARKRTPIVAVVSVGGTDLTESPAKNCNDQNRTQFIPSGQNARTAVALAQPETSKRSHSPRSCFQRPSICFFMYSSRAGRRGHLCSTALQDQSGGGRVFTPRRASGSAQQAACRSEWPALAAFWRRPTADRRPAAKPQKIGAWSCRGTFPEQR